MPENNTPLTACTVFLFAIASGLAVANVYFAQPLLHLIALDFKIKEHSIGQIVTLIQIGYGLGLFFIVPLGDILNRRKLILSQFFISIVMLLIISFTSHQFVFMGALLILGLSATVAQTIVAYAASLATPSQSGRVVGLVTSGIVIGILLARTTAGFLADVSGWRSVYTVSASATTLITVFLCYQLPKHDYPKSDTSYRKLLYSLFTLFKDEPIMLKRSVIALFLFASFSTLWTPLVLPLSTTPFSFSATEIGLFGLLGVIGSLSAARAGKLADRGRAQQTTGIALALLILSWLIMSYLYNNILLLITGIILLDYAVQAVHVTNQSILYKALPQAVSRTIAAYMIFYSIGSGIGALLSTQVYNKSGWSGVCLLGAGFSSIALIFWLLTLKKQNK